MIKNIRFRNALQSNQLDTIKSYIIINSIIQSFSHLIIIHGNWFTFQMELLSEWASMRIHVRNLRIYMAIFFSFSKKILFRSDIKCQRTRENKRNTIHFVIYRNYKIQWLFWNQLIEEKNRFLLITSYKHEEIVWRVLSKYYETISCNSCLYSHFHANRFVKLGFFLLCLHLIWTKNKRTKTITAFIFRIWLHWTRSIAHRYTYILYSRINLHRFTNNRPHWDITQRCCDEMATYRNGIKL